MASSTIKPQKGPKSQRIRITVQDLTDSDFKPFFDLHSSDLKYKLPFEKHAELAKNMLDENPDIAILMYDSASLKQKTFDSIATCAAIQTPMSHIATSVSDFGENPYSTTVFINKSVIRCLSIKQIPIFNAARKQISSVLVFEVSKLKDSMMVGNEARIGVIYAPLEKSTRKIVSEWLSQNAHLADVWTGSFNTLEIVKDGFISQVMTSDKLVDISSTRPVYGSTGVNDIRLPVKEGVDLNIGEIVGCDGENVYIVLDCPIRNHVFYNKDFKKHVRVAFGMLVWVSWHSQVKIVLG